MKKTWLIGLSVALMAGAVFMFKVFAVTQSQESAVVEGSVMSLNQTPSLPILNLETADGEIVNVTIDKDTTVLLDNKVSSLDQITVGQRVKVHYAIKNGKRVTNSIAIVSPTLSFPPADKAPSSTNQ